MATNYKFGPSTIMSAVAVSSTTIFNSTAIDFGFNQLASAQVSWTGTPTGTLTVQGSNDNVNWITLTATGITSPAGGASSTFVTVGPGGNIVNNMTNYIRFVYTNASGSGTMTMIATTKGI